MNLFAITILVATVAIYINAAPIEQSENSEAIESQSSLDSDFDEGVKKPEKERVRRAIESQSSLDSDFDEGVKKPESMQRTFEAELPDRSSDKSEPILVDQNTFTLQSIDACLDILSRLQSIIKSSNN